MPEKEKIEARIERLKKDAAAAGYLINPDEQLVYNLASGLLTNKERYGIESCPCRLYKGNTEDNLDIICPCDYRDRDVDEYGACFCALYVSPQTMTKGGPTEQVPERRPALEERKKAAAKQPSGGSVSDLAYPVWRCKVCGYLCANDQPPLVCPICKAQKERFERFI